MTLLGQLPVEYIRKKWEKWSPNKSLLKVCLARFKELNFDVAAVAKVIVDEVLKK